MYLLSDLDFSLPLSNPVIIFSLVLFIILFAPILFNKIRIPHIIGLIIAGILIGPYGFNLLRRDSSIVLFGTVGLLYIMFLAGLEIDLGEFRKNRGKILVFGLATFLIPLTLGSLASYYILGYGFMSSLLLASMFSSHTLVSYPIASKYGVTRNRAVTLTIGGTMITDILALMILAIVAGMTRGEIGSAFWMRLGISTAVFAAIVLFVFPMIAGWFFKRFDDNISQYIFVLALVFLGSFLAEAAGVEAIIGAFLSGLALNRYIPHSSPLMNRIDFVGNALFIPFFLISVGMLVDISVLFKGLGALKVAGVILLVAVSGKFLAAWVTQKSFRMSLNERNMIFGLSNSHAAATLAIILVGYNIIIGETPNGDPIRLLSEDVLNGTILLILVSCTISSFVVEKASRNLVLEEESAAPDGEKPQENILISLAYPETVQPLIDLGVMLKSRNAESRLFALHIIDEENGESLVEATRRKMMDKAVRYAAGSDNVLIPVIRYDQNISNGIIYSILEQNISDVVIGLHQNPQKDDFFGNTIERILKRTRETIFIYRNGPSFNVLKRMVVVVPPKAEYEPGFSYWFQKLTNIAREAGLSMKFYGQTSTLSHLKNLYAKRKLSVQVEFEAFVNWDDFLIFSREVGSKDLFVIVSSRRGYGSYLPAFDKLPEHLIRYFQDNSFIILYPKQLDHGVKMEDIQHFDTTLIDSLSGNMNQVSNWGRFVKKLFQRDKKE